MLKRVRIDESPVYFYYNDEKIHYRYWETIAMDRIRFQRRIKVIEKIIMPILIKKIKTLIELK